MRSRAGERGRDPGSSASSPPSLAGPGEDGGDHLRLAPGAEFDLIRRFLPRVSAPRGDVRVGPGDDCAVVVADGLALSSDLSVEDVHFRRSWLSPDQIGYRAATAALSDLAAVAARPIGVLVSLATPEETAGDFAVQLMEGVHRAVAYAGGMVLGGDLARSPGPLVIDVTAVGEAPSPVLRSGARPGDEVWVTGELGGSAVAVRQLLRGETPDAGAMERFASPVARVHEALWLRSHGVLHAMLDLSDGLLGDAAHLATAGGVAVVLERHAIPRHPSTLAAAATDEEALRLAVSGGEDYEICFCAPAGAVGLLAAEFQREFGVRLTRVGRVEEGRGVFWGSAQGRVAVEKGGFQHFGESS